MKTSLFITIILAVFIKPAKSQNAVFDFPNWPNGDITPVKYGSMASLRINNINTLFYKVTIKGEKVLNSTPTPAVLQELFRLPDPAKQASDATEGAGEGAKATKEMEKVAKTAVGASLKPEMDELVKLCNDFLAEADKVVKIKLRRAELTTLAKFPWRDYKTLSAKLPAPLTVSVMQGDIQSFLKAYGKAEAQYKNALAAAAPGSKEEERIKEALKEFEEAYENIDEDNLAKIIDDVMALQNALENDAFFSVSAPQVQADDCDFIKYSIIIEPDQLNSRLLPAGGIQPIDVEIPVRGGWKADFSVGLNYSFGNGAKDEKYYLTPPSEGNGTLTVGANANVVRPNIAAMLHAYPRTGKNYAAGFMMGVGAGFKAENTLTASYYLGGSLVLGKSQKIILNTGVSFLAVDRLKADYRTDVGYPVETTKISDVTEKALKPSFFFGISYNITNRVIVK